MFGTQMPHLTDALRWLPLLLVRSGEHRVAIQVDGLLGNRQIVVKSIGAQLSTVRWFTGGTILADGQIALILDVNSLVRMDSAQPVAAESMAAGPVTKGVSVMVVDDSITVRKVTSRLLERHNMQVVTARDGVDAVTQLQEHHPDVMLLDIEMPRMDGYELARHMRSTPELSDIPIIMITSRTGEKHRNRALELGVRRYLGKPYQEADLLENIYTVLADTAL
jgi:chemosensory pili system protein ChpA (sensor histidine kinase/response regulator)